MSRSGYYIYLLLLLFVLCTSVHFGSGLRCYVCNSKTNSSCYSSPPEEFIVDCKTQHQRLPTNRTDIDFKVCRSMYMNIDGQERSVARSCGWLEDERDCYTTATMLVKSKVCQCREDGCNAAAAVGPSLLAVLLTAALFYGVTR